MIALAKRKQEMMSGTEVLNPTLPEIRPKGQTLLKPITCMKRYHVKMATLQLKNKMVHCLNVIVIERACCRGKHIAPSRGKII